MGKKLVLLDKIYNITSGKKRHDFIIRYNKYLRELVKGFSRTKININKLRNYDNRFEIFISGPEEIFVYNLFLEEIGSINNFKDIKIGNTYKGTMTDVGKVGFGIFIDCGIFNPKIDVLIELRTFRNQLCRGNKISLREIINAYEFVDHFPVYVKISHIDIENNKIKGELDDKTLDIFKKLMDENIEAIFLSGETKGQFKKALIQKGHLRDIVSLLRFGFLEHIVILKTDSNAPGIISEIGRYLRNCKLTAIRPGKIKKLFE
jgi:hypothetical protein